MGRRSAGRTDIRVSEGDGEDTGRRGPKGLEERLLKARTVSLFEPITPVSSRRVVSSLFVLEAEDHAAPITVLINSPGGSVDDGFAIYDTMRLLRSPVRALCVGLAASAANIVLLGAPKGSRLALPNTRILIHQPSTGVQGQASDIAITAREILKTREHLNRLLHEETGQSLEKIAEDTNRDYWMSAAEAKAYGLVDRVVTRWKDLG
jgi:ATP-dependent Clp protease protease subunit